MHQIVVSFFDSFFLKMHQNLFVDWFLPIQATEIIPRCVVALWVVIAFDQL